jgi:UPF0755 protein
MTDGSQRSAQEREAARRERERRRTGVFNVPEDPSPVDWADENGSGRAATDGADDANRSLEGNRGYAAAVPDEDNRPDEDEDEDEDEARPGRDEAGVGELEAVPGEIPAGTRRVSRVPSRDTRRRAPQTKARRRATPPPRRARRTTARGVGREGRGHSLVGRTIALVAVIIAAVFIWFVIALFEPFGSSPHGQVTVVVPGHAGAHQIGDLLARDGVVSSGLFFELRASLAGDRSSLRSGTYHLQQGMSYAAVLTALTKVPKAAPTTTLTLAEGHTRAYVAALLRRQHIRGNYLALTRRSPLLNPVDYGAPAGVPLEGFLFPDTFTLLDPVKASALVDDQLRDFKQRIATVNMSYARSKHLTVYDVLKIASMIEAEAASERDRPLIASVIYNRLHDGMMLQFDSTTRYATGNFTRPLTVSELQSPSPWNTHTHPGLPPTPINSPGLASIEAAARPAQTNYLYFFTKPCNAGASVYTSTYSEFLYLLAKDRRDHC